MNETVAVHEYNIDWYKQETERLERELKEAQARYKIAEHEVALRGYTINKLSNRIGKQRAAYKKFRKNFNQNAISAAARKIVEEIGQNK